MGVCAYTADAHKSSMKLARWQEGDLFNLASARSCFNHVIGEFNLAYLQAVSVPLNDSFPHFIGTRDELVRS